MVIKTVASFTARPMLWFGMLSLPMLAAATAALGWTGVHARRARKNVAAHRRHGGDLPHLDHDAARRGALGELIYKLGDVREHQFSGLTQHLLVRGAVIDD